MGFFTPQKLSKAAEKNLKAMIYGWWFQPPNFLKKYVQVKWDPISPPPHFFFFGGGGGN